MDVIPKIAAPLGLLCMDPDREGCVRACHNCDV